MEQMEQETLHAIASNKPRDAAQRNHLLPRDARIQGGPKNWQNEIGTILCTP